MTPRQALLRIAEMLFPCPIEPIEVRRQRVWEEQRKYERRNRDADAAKLEAMIPVHRERMKEASQRMSMEELESRIRWIGHVGTLEMPGGHINMMYLLDQETRDVFADERIRRLANRP
jgi:hypothetical protein